MELDVFVCYLPLVKTGVVGKDAEVQQHKQTRHVTLHSNHGYLCVCSCTYLPRKGAKSYAGYVR